MSGFEAFVLHLRRPAVGICAAILAMTGTITATAPVALATTTNTWATTGALPSATTHPSFVTLADGRVFVDGGGYAGNGNAYILSVPQVFDPSTGTWSATSDPPWAPDALESLVAVRIGDGRVFVAGGEKSGSGGYVSKKAYLYDPTGPNGGSWTPVADMPYVSAGAAAALMADGRVMLAGGAGTEQYAFAYDPTANSWATLANLSATNFAGRLLLLHDGRLLLYGGNDGLWNLGALYVYDPVKNTWTLGPVSIGGGAPEAVNLPDGRVLVAGGLGVSNTLANVAILDLVHNTWTPGASMHVGRNDFTLISMSNGLILAAGGFTPPASQAAEVYDLGTNTWYPATSMHDLHGGQASALLLDGRVLVAGGDGSSAEIYTPGDLAPPTIGTPLVSLRSGATMSSTVPARLTWSTADGGGSGLATVDLQRSTNGGSYANVLLGSTATSLNVSLTPGTSYRYRVRGRDHVGNLSAWHYSTTVTPVVTQQSTTKVTWYKTWTTTTYSSYSGGTSRNSTTASASATYTFTGRSIAWVTARSTSRGQARVYVDNVLVATIDTYLASAQYRYVAYAKTWTSSANHTIKIVVVATSGRPRVDVDAFEYLH